MTVNHGKYYIDTTASKAYQQASGSLHYNAFLAGKTYYVFFLYGTNSTKQVYSLFIGKKLSGSDYVLTPGRVGNLNNSFPFTADPSGAWAKSTYDSDTGILTVNVDLSSAEDLEPANRSGFCRPTTFCSWNRSNYTCGCNKSAGQCQDGSTCTPGGSCKDGSTCASICTDDKVCSFGTKDIDCPEAGCYGFSIKLPSTFATSNPPLDPPAPALFTEDPYFNTGTVTFEALSQSAAGNCFYPSAPKQQMQPPLPRPTSFRQLLNETNR
jgi:cell migration-inducing and hyaluronan-binding protein